MLTALLFVDGMFDLLLRDESLCQQNLANLATGVGCALWRGCNGGDWRLRVLPSGRCCDRGGVCAIEFEHPFGIGVFGFQASSRVI